MRVICNKCTNVSNTTMCSNCGTDEYTMKYVPNDRTRLFFVVDADNVNDELFETYEDSELYAEALRQQKEPGVRVRICIVRNSYREVNGWNYDDLSNTFETVSDITGYVL